MNYVMLKPASGQCNLRCTYCFYQDEAQNRQTPSYGHMSLETLQCVVDKVCKAARDGCVFVFQGGEPTLRGLEFYQALLRMQEPYRRQGLSIQNTIQTNGILIDEAWSAFLSQNHFLVGLSLDGTPEIHDALRPDPTGQGSYLRVKQAADLLQAAGAAYNIVTVVTKSVANSAKNIYNQYLQNGWDYLQFIPCLDPYGETPGQYAFSLTPEDYGTFLCDLFDVWYEDVRQGKIIYIRYFENILGMLLGFPPESCGVCGTCAKEYVVEADGSVYPCDFYVLDEWRLGNLNTDSLRRIDAREAELGFLRRSLSKPPECLACPWYRLCGGGCIRNRDFGGKIGSNYFCAAFKRFFTYTMPRFQEIIKLIQERHAQSGGS